MLLLLFILMHTKAYVDALCQALRVAFYANYAFPSIAFKLLHCTLRPQAGGARRAITVVALGIAPNADGLLHVVLT